MVKLYKYNSSIDIIIGKIVEDFNIGRQNKIFIKPNLGGRYPIIAGENTCYDIMKAICNILINKGCEEIVIGHGSLLNYGGDKYDFDSLLKCSGLSRLTKFRKVKFLNLDKSKRLKFKFKEFEVGLPDILMTHIYINLCCFKTHMETTVSLSIKNQMGLLSMEDRKRMHRTNLSKYLAYLANIARPHINIMDGRISMEGNGPHHGISKRTNVIIAANDMVELDSLACLLGGINYNFVEHIKTAIEEGAGKPIDEEVFNKDFKKYATKFLCPENAYKKYIFLKVWPNNACSGCIFSLSDAHKKIKNRPPSLIQLLMKLIKVRGLDIVLGKNAEKNRYKYSSKVIFIGDCTKEFADYHKEGTFIAGCPPKSEYIIHALIKE